MLTKSQIQRAAVKSGVGVQVQERDYLQHLLLWLLYARRQALVFGGGTALRMVYGGNRYAEKLEFHGSGDTLSSEELRELCQGVVKGLADFGVVAEMDNEMTLPDRYRFHVRCQGPLYDGRDRSEGLVRVDVNRRPEKVDVRRELVTSEYADVRPFVVTVLTPEQLMAEKIRAVLVRGEPRDLYDLWLMLGLGIQPAHEVIERKLARYGIGWHLRRLVNALDLLEIGWERDLQHLLPQYVPFKTARDGVVAWLVGV